jgi:hypothetical protein
MSTDRSIFDRTFGIAVIVYGGVDILGTLGVLEPRIVSLILPLLIVLVGIKITLSDMK